MVLIKTHLGLQSLGGDLVDFSVESFRKSRQHCHTAREENTPGHLLSNIHAALLKIENILSDLMVIFKFFSV
jgi:hypothetical protein